jgi:hypothetical protein
MSLTPRDIDTHGLLFFVHNFSSAPFFDGSFANKYPKSLFEEVEVDASLRNSVISIGLAAVSNVNRDPALLSEARQRYGVTLNEVRRTILNLSYANVGSVLRLILMLAIFEVSVSETGSSLTYGVMADDGRWWMHGQTHFPLERPKGRPI